MKKRLAVLTLTAVMTFSAITSSFACTGFVAGKAATADGSRIIARTEDLSGAHNKTFKVYPRKENAKPVMFEDPIGFKLELPKTSYQYTAICDAEQSEGIYDEVGFNEHGVAISATVSATPGKEVQKHDPLVENGLSEASMTTVVLPYVKTAKEAVQRTASIIDKHGSAEGNIVFFADQKEIWYMEILSGHQYAAMKVPEDSYAVIPNHYFMGYIDVKSPDVIVSKNLVSLPKEKGFYKELNGKFHVALTYSDEVEDYDRVRIWGGQNKLSPSQKVAYDTKVFSLWRKPDKKISVKDVMELQRYRYEDTDKNANLEANKDVRAIGTPTSMECHVIQMKDSLPKEVGGVMWMVMANAEHSVYLPFHGNITDTIAPYKVADEQYTPDSFYWTMRMLNVNSSLDREKFGKNVRAYWNEYENKLIAEQDKKDKELTDIYKKQGKAAAASYATKTANKNAEDVFAKATQLNKELNTYIAGNNGKSKKDPFMPSFMKKEK